MTPEDLKKRKAALEHHVHATEAVGKAVASGKEAGLEGDALAAHASATVGKMRTEGAGAPANPSVEAQVNEFLAKAHPDGFLRALYEALDAKYGEKARPGADWLKKKIGQGYRAPPTTK